jgi:large subunit ribosomal protein L21
VSYAVVDIGGKQYRISTGDVIRVEKMKEDPGTNVVLDKVLLVSTDEEVKTGRPFIDGATVEAKVLEHGKEEKVLVFKFKRKKNYRRLRGHRQPFTDLQIGEIKVR